MKIEFDPTHDTPQDVAGFIQECFEKGMRVEISVKKPLKRLPAPAGALPAALPALTAAGAARKRAPIITHEIYELIKAGDPAARAAYSRAARAAVEKSKNWASFQAKKRRVRAAKARRNGLHG